MKGKTRWDEGGPAGFYRFITASSLILDGFTWEMEERGREKSVVNRAIWDRIAFANMVGP